MRQYLPIEIARLFKSATTRGQGTINTAGGSLQVSFGGKTQALPRGTNETVTRVARSR